MSLPHPPPTHIHLTEYADPVLRPPSPTSSIGTAYAEDQTSFSDSEAQLSQLAFERKVLEKLALDEPREEELKAEKEVLVMVPVNLPGGGQKMVRAWDLEDKLPPAEGKALCDRIMTSLRAEIAQLQENEQFEQILLRGSKAALETQPSTNDIDALMRSMMGPAMNLSSGAGSGGGPQAHTGRSTSAWLPPNQMQRNDPSQFSVGISHPQPQHGAFHFERRDNSSTLAPPSSVTLMNELSGSTVGGKRSRNGTSRARNA